MKLYPGLVLSPDEASAVFVAAQAKVGPDLVAYFDSHDCEFCNDCGITFQGPHSGGHYTVVECEVCQAWQYDDGAAYQKRLGDELKAESLRLFHPKF